MMQGGVIKNPGQGAAGGSKAALVYGQMNEPPGTRESSSRSQRHPLCKS